MPIDSSKKADFDIVDLKRNPASPRTLFGLVMSSIAGLFTMMAIIPLIIILLYLIIKGVGSLSPSVIAELPPPPLVEGGGFGNAILGTVMMVGIGILISVPIGIMAAVFLSEFNGHQDFGWEKVVDIIIKVIIGLTIGLGLGIILNALVGGVIGFSIQILCIFGFAILLTRIKNIVEWISFATNILSGVPSIIVGVFVYGAIVLNGIAIPKLGFIPSIEILPKGYSAWAGGFALAVLMLPIIVRTTDEALKLVPQDVRQASAGIGANQYQTVLQVVLPAALPAIITGVTLSVARAAGETAPLLFTALFTQYWPNWNNGLAEPTASLAVLVYNFAIVPFKNQQELAWGAAFVLVLMVLITSIASRMATAKRTY